METEEWKKQYLKQNAGEIGKKAKPVLRGLITEYNGKQQIGLWPTEEFKQFIKDAVKELMKEA